MAPRRRSLIRAAENPIREDRLTEILAAVLDAHLAFANRLLQEADLPVGDAVEVSTQVSTPRGKRIDLQVDSVDSRGRRLARLWSEDKTGSPFSKGQLEGYASELDEYFDGRRRLITIVDRLDEAPEDDRWTRLTWRRIAAIAAEVGAGRDHPDGLAWRKKANSRDARADQRLLDELIAYLKEEHNAVIEPISHLDVIALSRRRQAEGTRDNIIRRAREVSQLDPDGGLDLKQGHRLQNFKLASSWSARLGGAAQLRASSSDPWAFPRIDEPAFGAGFSLPSHYHDALRDSRNHDWLSATEEQGYFISLDRKRYGTGVFRTLYIAELISKGATQDEQAAFLARWIDESIELLQDHDPGIEPSEDKSDDLDDEASDEDDADL